MKTFHPTFILGSFLLFFISCNSKPVNKQPGKYFISGKINGLHSGIIKLIKRNEVDETSVTIDSSAFENDSFHLEGKLDYAQLLTLVIEPGNWELPVFVENSNIKIEGDTTGSTYWAVREGNKIANLKNFTITGSKSNDDYMLFKNDPELKRYSLNMQKYNRQIDTFSKINIDKEYDARGRADSFGKILLTAYLNYASNYIIQNPSSPVGAYILQKIYISMQDKPLAQINNLLSRFVGDAKKSSYYKSIVSTQQEVEALQPGSIAPNFTLLQRDSSKFTLSSLRGSYTMIDFWASWCYPCRKAIPRWKEVYNKYHSKGFNIIGVSDDYNWKSWFKALDQEKMPWKQVCDEFPVNDKPAKVASLYQSAYMPFYVLLDREGKILVYSGNEDDIHNKLKEIFGD